MPAVLPPEPFAFQPSWATDSMALKVTRSIGESVSFFHWWWELGGTRISEENIPASSSWPGSARLSTSRKSSELYLT